MRNLLLLPRRLAILLIDVYQATLSPDHGPLKGLHPYGFCRHEPTCSEYGKRIIRERGLLIGGLLTLGRLLSCNPWTKPTPEKILKITGMSSQ